MKLGTAEIPTAEISRAYGETEDDILKRAFGRRVGCRIKLGWISHDKAMQGNLTAEAQHDKVKRTIHLSKTNASQSDNKASMQ